MTQSSADTEISSGYVKFAFKENESKEECEHIVKNYIKTSLNSVVKETAYQKPENKTAN